MPFGPRFPRPGVVLPRRFRGEREHRDVGCVADLLFGIAAEETNESDSVEVHTFPFLPVCLGHPEASGRGSQDQKLLFWGDRHGGARTGTGQKAKQKLRRRRAPQEPRSCGETDGWNRERTRNRSDMVRRSPRYCRHNVKIAVDGPCAGIEADVPQAAGRNGGISMLTLCSLSPGVPMVEPGQTVAAQSHWHRRLA